MTAYVAGSYRDRGARMMRSGSRMLRAMSAEALDQWRLISPLPFFQAFMTSGQIVRSWELRELDELVCPDWAAGWLEHEPVPFVSYPYEWSFSMLRDAALLHLEILTAALPAGVILKDASPYNVQFVSGRPTFIDIGSFVDHQPQEPWNGYRQFCELMLFPLLVQSYRGFDFQSLLRSNLEGIPVQQARRLFSWRDVCRSGVWTHVVMQGIVERMTGGDTGGTRQTLQASGFSRDLIAHNLRRLTRLVSRLRWSPPPTKWTDYNTRFPHVTSDQPAKAAFIEQVCRARRRNLVWDLGCNDGRMARLAAESARTVIAMDDDHGHIERLYRSLHDGGPTNILPLRINLANPSPGCGWRGTERLRLEDRGRPDLVLCLGLIHHLTIGCNLPLEEVVGWFAEITDELILEFPTKQDAMVQALLRNKPDQYSDYSLELLQRELSRDFQIDQVLPLPSGERHLIHAVRRS